MKRKILHLFEFVVLVLLIGSCNNSTEPEKEKNEIPELVLINENLTFTMGCLDLPGWYYTNLTEKPTFKATLSPYYIGKYEVRNDEYEYFVNELGYSDSTLWSDSGWAYINAEKRDRPVNWMKGEKPWSNCELSNTIDRPISNICWYEAEAYCNWLSRKTSESFSLPTEAQWERAARGPDPGRIFTWGNVHDKSKYNHIMASSKLFPVGTYQEDKSYEGCFDMAGNLTEYCSDWFELYIYTKYKENEPVYNPSGPIESNTNGQKSWRGTFTGFHHDREIEYQITTFRRMGWMLKNHSRMLGFRVVKNIK